MMLSALSWPVLKNVGEKAEEHHVAHLVMWPLEGLSFEKQMLMLVAKLFFWVWCYVLCV